MAENIVAGLFGLDPYQIQQQRQAQFDAQAKEMANMGGFELAGYLGGKAGAGLAQVGAGMLGMVDPLQEKARMQQAAMQGADLTTPEGLKAVALRFNQLGMPQQAMIAAAKANELEKTQQELALKNAQESLIYANAMKALREPTNLTEAIKEYKFAKEEEGYAGTFQDWIKQKAEATGKGESVSPIAYIDESGKPVWGTIREARGKQAAQYSPETKGAIAGATEKGKEEAKREINMAGINEVIREAEDLLTGASGKPLPTGSGIGTAYDISAGVFGASPSGAAEAQRLKAIGGALTSKMPRMEGPQSDKDTQLYKEMAGVVGDSTIPRERRIAALNTVKELWGKYANKNVSKQEWTAKTPEEVRSLYKAGRLSKEEARAILKDMGFQNGR